MSESVEHCELCGAPLDADNCYGNDDFRLCRFHYQKLTDLVNFMATGQYPLPEPSVEDWRPLPAGPEVEGC